MLARMRIAKNTFYTQARAIGCHPFIEFAGLMHEYIQSCQAAHDAGVDFTQCSAHTGVPLPMKEYQVKYANEKLQCIFTGRSVIDESKT